MNRLYCLVILLAVLAGCTSHPENVTEADTLPAIYPDYIDVTIPTGIAPLNFSMADDSVTTIDVTIKGKDDKTILPCDAAGCVGRMYFPSGERD